MNNFLMQASFRATVPTIFLATSLWYRYKGQKFDAAYYLFLTYMVASLF